MESSADHTHTGEPNQPKHVANIPFSIKLYQSILNVRGWKLVMLYLATRPSLLSGATIRDTLIVVLRPLFFKSNFYHAILNARGWKLVMLHLATRPNLCQKTIRSLKHSFQSCTVLPGFSQVQSEPSRKLDQCDKQSHLDLFNPFQEQFKQFYQI